MSTRLKLFLTAIMLTSMAMAQNISEPAQNVPPEVQQIINDVINGKNAIDGVIKTIPGIDSSTILSNLKAGIPIQKYMIRTDSLSKLSENAPISHLIMPLPFWIVPLINKLTDSIFTDFEVVKNKNFNGQWHVRGISMGKSGFWDEWQKIINKWPRSNGYNPKLIVRGDISFIYVPEKDDFNLTCFASRKFTISGIEQNSDSTYSALTDSKITLKFLKNNLRSGLLNGGKPK